MDTLIVRKMTLFHKCKATMLGSLIVQPHIVQKVYWRNIMSAESSSQAYACTPHGQRKSQIVSHLIVNFYYKTYLVPTCMNISTTDTNSTQECNHEVMKQVLVQRNKQNKIICTNQELKKKRNSKHLPNADETRVIVQPILNFMPASRNTW